MKCEVCGASPVVHICDVRDGIATDRSLCETHAREAGYPLPSATELALPKLQRVIAFIKVYGRFPSGMELYEKDVPPGMPVVEPENEEVAEALAEMESLAEFIQTHGRLPSDEEEKAL